MGVPEGREKMPSLPTATARCLAPRPRIAILAPRSPRAPPRSYHRFDVRFMLALARGWRDVDCASGKGQG